MRQRGSAMVYALIMLTVVTVMVAAMMDFESGFRTNVLRNEHRVRAKAAFESAIATLQSQRAAGSTALTLNLTGPPSVVITAVDNSGSVNRSLSVTGTAVIDSDSFTFNSIIADRFNPLLFFYAVAQQSNHRIDEVVTSGTAGSGGDFYCGDNLDFHNGATINGDLEAAGTISGSPTVTGNQLANQPSITWPTPSRANYQSAADVSAVNGTLSNPTFLLSLLGQYMLYYYSGNVTISGTVTGRACIYVRGKVSISGDMSYGVGGTLVVIAESDVTVQSGVNTVVGYYYTGTKFAAGKSFSLFGSIVCDNLEIGKPITVSNDPYLWNNSGEAYKLKVPGAWP